MPYISYPADSCQGPTALEFTTNRALHIPLTKPHVPLTKSDQMRVLSPDSEGLQYFEKGLVGAGLVQ